MNEPTPVPINLDPNIYTISNVNIGSSEEEFTIQIASGNQLRQYSLSPKHAKRLSLLLVKVLEGYEKTFGTLITQLPEVPKETEKKSFGFTTEDNKEQ